MLTTARLVIRPWTEADRAPFEAMSADAAVMRYLRPLPDRAASDAWIDRQIARVAEGYGMRAVCDAEGFVGSVGLARVPYEAHFTPAVEIGWRFVRRVWGRGYAPEAAAALLAEGFGRFGLKEIVANASVGNLASQRVMAKLGMVRDAADDFDHPLLAEGDPIRRQVLFRIRRPAPQ